MQKYFKNDETGEINENPFYDSLYELLSINKA